MKIASIIGARPEFVQAAVVSRTLRERHDEVLIHTGQHYDDLMSDVFFRELGLPAPDVNLSVGSGPASEQLGQLIARLSIALDEHRPDIVIVRGDTNSTLAGAIVARQNGYPLAHIEGGMRSYDRRMPEETNRVLTDHVSDWLFVTGADAAENLKREGSTQNVFVVGDVMYDTFLRVVRDILPRHAARIALPERYDLLTIHRQDNTENRTVLERLLQGFAGAPFPVIFPAHPRTRARIESFAIEVPTEIRMIEPLSYLDMLTAETNARLIFTDSGGVQRESYFAKKPCLTLRETTEWTNTVNAGWNQLVGSDTAKIAAFLREPPEVPRSHPSIFGNGDAAGRIVEILESEQSEETIKFWEEHRRSVLHR